MHSGDVVDPVGGLDNALGESAGDILLCDIGVKVFHLMRMFFDSQVATYIASNLVFHERPFEHKHKRLRQTGQQAGRPRRRQGKLGDARAGAGCGTRQLRQVMQRLRRHRGAKCRLGARH
ncbi:unnamed protein product [Ilex paraguariensis]|uniref:Uncharacterized protein n=1 Tax=Ilex paraguariensis TaxID=185542 RepID=A0ABC8SPS5_9AQUA